MMSKTEALDEYFELTPKGVVTDKWSKARVFVMSSRGWSKMMAEIRAVFSNEASLILGRMGYSYGRELGKAIKKTGKDPIEAFGEVVQIARLAGWGKMTLLTGDPFGSSASVSFEDCVFCAGAVEDGTSSCDFVTGVLTGAFEETTGNDYGALEKFCHAKGDAFCQFNLERKS